MATSGERLRQFAREVKRRIEPVQFKLLEEKDPRFSFVREIADAFSYRLDPIAHRKTTIYELAVAELRGTTHKLLIVGEQEVVASAKFQRIFSGTNKTPFDDNHIYVRVETNRGVQDAHYFKNVLAGVRNRVDEFLVNTTQLRPIPRSIDRPVQIMFMHWVGQRVSVGPLYAGVSLA